MTELTRADVIALYGNGERAWKRSEGYVEVDPRDLMALCLAFLNTRAPIPATPGEDRVREILRRILSAAEYPGSTIGEAELSRSFKDEIQAALAQKEGGK